MRFAFIIILSILLPINLFSQVLKGKITNQYGEPIPYATVYIKEIRQGTLANTKGDYSIKLSPGKYAFTFQSMGYEPVYEEIVLSDGTVTRNVILPVQYYQVPEVRITASGEDPAYIIMRKVIGMAPYYLNHISFYKAEVYLKGNLAVNNIPRLIERSMEKQAKKGEEIPFREGDTYFMESYNEIEFTAPDRYNQKVLSINSTFPEQGNEISPMEFIQASFYEPQIVDMAISPLSPSAFSHYNFKYTGLSMQGEFVINKIQVTPKRKSQQLFEGTIYIIEDLWCLHSVDLVNENLAGRIRVKQLYVPVSEGLWMPVSHNFEVNIDIMNIRADATYGSSVKYLEVRPNKNLKRPETIATNTPVKREETTDSLPATKTEEQINKILSKNELTNRDMVRLSKLMEKKAENSQSDTVKKSLEIVDKTVQKVEKDANKKDSTYWSQIRPIPLSEIEKKSIRVSDSLKTSSEIRKISRDTAFVQETQERKDNKALNTLRHVATGHTWRDTTGNVLRFGGLLNLKSFNFNTVDGFVYGIDFGYSRSWKNNSFRIDPEIKWAFSRQQLIWRVNSFYRFGSGNLRQIYVRTGQASSDFNTGGGINLFLNTSMSLLLRKNYLKLYESGYFTLGYITDIATGLNFDISAAYEDRSMLENNTDFSLFKSSREYTENVPLNPFLTPGSSPLYAVSDMRHARLRATVNFTPFMKYRVAGKRRIPMGSDWPSFSLTWLHGINEFTELADPIKHYDMLRFEAHRRTELGAFSEFRWRVRTGGFLDNKYVTFYDFYHVNTQPVPLLLSNYEDAFRLPAFYSMSTPEFYVQAHTRFTTPYLLLKFLPFLSNTLMRENLSLSYMGFSDGHYTELGYAVSEIFLFGEVGVYVGFKDLGFRSAGVSIVLKLD
jgi:hypothetical protein